MKKLIAILIISLNYFNIFAQLNYVDARKLTLVGKAMDTGQSYHRIDTALYNNMPKKVKSLLTCSAGLAISFKTNSNIIAAKWTVSNRKADDNMTLISQKGLDLYIKKGEQWIFAGVGRPSEITSQKVIIENMDNEEKECLLYLPLYDEIKDLQIGVSERSLIEPLANPFFKKVVIYGSSIVQGASASRPGMAYPSRLSRNTGINFINLGISGNAKMEKEVADMISDIEVDAYILDCVPNASEEEIKERTSYLVKTIRKNHPAAPIIMIESMKRESGNYNEIIRKKVFEKNKAFEKEYQRLMAEGLENLFYIRGSNLLGTDHEGTTDGTHPNDIGFDRMINIIQPQLVDIINRYTK